MPPSAPGVPDRLREALTGDAGLAERIRPLFDHPVFVPRECPSVEDYHHLNHERLRVLNDRLGGGRAALRSPERLFAVLGHAAVIDPSLFLRAMVHYEVCLNAALLLGDGNAELDEAVARLDTLSTIGNVLITEVGRGGSHVSVRTRAEYDPSLPGFRITTPTPDDAKFMAPVGPDATAHAGVVYARLHTTEGDHGVFPFLVDLHDGKRPAPGVRVTRLPHSTVSPLPHSLVSFHSAPVPFGRWLRDTAEISPQGRFEEPSTRADDRLVRSLTVSSAASAAGATALAAVTRATAGLVHRYSRHRVTTSAICENAPVIDYKIQQESVYGALAEAYATTFLVHRALHRRARESTEPTPGRRTTWAPWTAVSRELSLAKVEATASAERVCAESRRRCGAHGTLTVNRIPVYEALSHIYNSAGGDNRLILLDTGRELVSTTDHSPPEAVPPEGRDPADPRMWSYLFGEHERTLHARARSTLGDTIGTAGSLERWNEHLWLLLDLASAHARRLAFDAFAESLEELRGTEAHATLAPLFGLWALNGIIDRAAEHLASGSLTPEEYTAMRDLRRSLLGEIDAEVLVDALDVPFEQIRAPLASPDYVRLLGTAGA